MSWGVTGVSHPNNLDTTLYRNLFAFNFTPIIIPDAVI